MKLITQNRKARYEYHILETYEAGISLVGTEVKSLRNNKVNLTDAYAQLRNGEVWLVKAHINVYDHGNIQNHDPERQRKLLLHKSEIRKLKKAIDEKGNSLIPLSLYFKDGKIKVELAVAKGKKLHDKRKDIAEKDMKREIQRKIKI
ncbi:MAG: SsrA-binding protein [Melioribacteraceae bacterium]|nr:MAG: SsrA-binding protein [Melioribacteraceae bacterium]